MAATYKGLLTNNGKALIASATLNNKINYSHIAVGDGNGSVPNPLETRTALVNEKARIALNVVEINPNNTNQIICEAIIPSNLGGFYIRELGLYAGATLVVNASYPPTYKPLVDEGGAREIAIKLVINIQNAEVIALYLDDSLIYATRAWVDTNYIRRNELVDNLTTDDAKKPVSAKQAKNLQDNKLDKTANAVSATKLKNARKINNVDFDGSDDINIEAPLRLAGHITTLEQLNAAVVDGKYTVGDLIIAGMYWYGVLVVLRSGGVCHQIYYPHEASGVNNATMGLRQTWNLNGNTATWSEWRVIGTRDDSKLPLAGGTLSGKLTTRPSVLALTLDDLGGGNNAPLQTPHLHVPENTTAYIPFVHGSMQTTYNGYATQISIGGYRGSNTWENSGAYIAVGGRDAAPTEAFMFLNGRKISNTAGPIDLVGNASSANKLAIPRNVFGQTFDGSGDVGGTITASTGLIQASAFHFIDMGRNGLDRMNFHNYGAIFNFINTINGEVVARISGSGIDCNAASASKVINVGNSPAYEVVSANPPYGLTLASVYQNGYPTPFGNVLRLGGNGQGEILVGWPGEGGGLAPSFIRGKRDGGLDNWTSWREIVFVDSLPSHNVGSASKLKTPRKINNVDFDGTSDITVTDDALTYMPIPYPKSSPPTGYLAMMGQAISESTYPKLYALYGAVLPDMRAYTVRGLDYGRGIDVGRSVLSQQEDAIRNITGSLITGFLDAVGVGGAFAMGGTTSPNGAGVQGLNKKSATFDASRVVPVAAENRIKNIAFLYIVKAG